MREDNQRKTPTEDCYKQPGKEPAETQQAITRSSGSQASGSSRSSTTSTGTSKSSSSSNSQPTSSSSSLLHSDSPNKVTTNPSYPESPDFIATTQRKGKRSHKVNPSGTDRVGPTSTGKNTEASDLNQLTLNVEPKSDPRDKILIIDNIANPKVFIDSQEILKEVKKFSEIPIDFAYQLAKGGIALHVKSKEDRDLLRNQLPPKSFGGGIKHPPSQKAKSSNFFIKGVDTSIDIDDLRTILKTKSIHLTGIRRLLNRESGRPTKTVKLTCNNTESEKLSTQDRLIINGKNCHLERERKVKIIRCYNCQKFGHISANCKNKAVCVKCSCYHESSTFCNAEPKCANCEGPYPAYSSLCPVYLAYHANLTKQPDLCEHIDPPPQACP